MRFTNKTTRAAVEAIQFTGDNAAEITAWSDTVPPRVPPPELTGSSTTAPDFACVDGVLSFETVAGRVSITAGEWVIYYTVTGFGRITDDALRRAFK